MTPTPPGIPSRSNRTLHTFLLIAVVVLLAAILIVLAVNTGDNDDQTATIDNTEAETDESALDKPVESPRRAAHAFMSQVMVQRDVDDAEDFMCDNYQGLTPDELLEDLTTWESDNDVKASTMVSIADSSSRETVAVEVKIETGVMFVRWEYEVTVESDGDSFQVCEVQSTTVED